MDFSVSRCLNRSLKSLISCYLLISLVAPLSAETVVLEPINLPVPAYRIESYQKFLNGRAPTEVSDFSRAGEDVDRFIVDIILLQKAMKLGGFEVPLELTTMSDRAEQYIAHLRSGRMVVGPDVMPQGFMAAYKDDILITDAVIPLGQYFAGLYTSPNNNAALSVDISELSSLSAISDKNWPTDWSELVALQLSELQHADSWEYMVKSVVKQRVDFTPISFKRGDLTYRKKGYELVPIPGIKILLPDSYHFMISKKYPHSINLQQSINHGLKVLRKEGLIKRYYTESGLYNPLVEHWLVINQHAKGE